MMLPENARITPSLARKLNKHRKTTSFVRYYQANFRAGSVENGRHIWIIGAFFVGLQQVIVSWIAAKSILTNINCRKPTAYHCAYSAGARVDLHAECIAEIVLGIAFIVCFALPSKAERDQGISIWYAATICKILFSAVCYISRMRKESGLDFWELLVAYGRNGLPILYYCFSHNFGAI